jgi:hypothetical protein
MECPSIKELAAAVREDQMGFEEALLMHLENRHPDHFGMEAFFILSMAISYSNMGQPEVALELAGEKATAGEWVRRFGLEPFVEAE